MNNFNDYHILFDIFDTKEELLIDQGPLHVKIVHGIINPNNWKVSVDFKRRVSRLWLINALTLVSLRLNIRIQVVMRNGPNKNIRQNFIGWPV